MDALWMRWMRGCARMRSDALDALDALGACRALPMLILITAFWKGHIFPNPHSPSQRSLAGKDAAAAAPDCWHRCVGSAIIKLDFVVRSHFQVQVLCFRAIMDAKDHPRVPFACQTHFGLHTCTHAQVPPTPTAAATAAGAWAWQLHKHPTTSRGF